jgi:hypothetical protein
MLHQEWITNVVIHSDDTVDVDFLDGTHQVYSDPADVKEVFTRVADQENRITNGEDMIEGHYNEANLRS